MRYLYRDNEQISSPCPCEVLRHPWLSDGRTVAKAGAGEPFGPLPPGSYLVRCTVAPGEVRTRYLAVAAPGWTVVQMTSGLTGDRMDDIVHPRRVPMNYYLSVSQARKEPCFPAWQREYGDGIYLHLHPDSLGEIDPEFATSRQNWEDFSVPEIVERLRAIDGWMRGLGYAPLDGFASYTPSNSLVEAMRAVGWKILHSVVPEQNWSDGHWAINHWGMPNQPFYFAADDFRKSAPRGAAGPGRDVLGMSMDSYHLYMPHVVHWGDNVLSPSHFLRWHRTVESGPVPVRFENFLDDYLAVASGMSDSPYFLIAGFEFGRTFGTRSMTDHNRAGCECLLDRARCGGRIVFAAAADVAAWYERFLVHPPDSVFAQRDYLAGTRIMGKPIDSGPSVGMEMAAYKACFAHLCNLPFYHYDYTVPWHFPAADTSAPQDFAGDDAARVRVAVADGTARISAADPLPRATPVCLWDAVPESVPDGLRVFRPPVLDDGRSHAVLELPAGWRGSLSIPLTSTAGPDRAEFGGLVTPLWRVQTIGPGARRHSYAFLDTPLLSPCRVTFRVPRPCRIDSLERPLGAFVAGDTVTLEFDSRRTWFRFWGLSPAEIQPDAEAVRAIEAAAAEWREFSADAPAALAAIHEADDAFFRSVVPPEETLLLDIDCFGNAVFGERSRALPFDRTVYAAAPALVAREYADGGISRGFGKSFWVHPRGLGFQIEGIDALALPPGARLRVRLCTVVGENEPPLSYLMTASSGGRILLGGKTRALDDPGRVVWTCPRERTVDGMFAFDVSVSDISDGILSVGMRANQTKILGDWFAEGGFVARLERLLLTRLP